MTNAAMLKEEVTKLFELAAQTKDLRWKRYLLEEGRKLMALQDPIEVEARLANLTFAAQKAMSDAEGAAWLDGFLTALSRGLEA